MVNWKAKPSTSTYPLIGRPVDEALAITASAGFDRVDVLGRRPHFTPDETGVRVLRDAAERHGLRVANIASYGGQRFGEGDTAAAKAELDDTRRLLDAAAEVGAGSIRGYRVGSNNESLDHLPGLIEWYGRAAKHADGVGVSIGVECHGGVISGSPERLVELCHGVGSGRFGIIYDPANLLTAGADPHDAFNMFKKHIVLVHLKDGVRGERDSVKTTMLGDGELDLSRVICELDEIEYVGDVVLEYEVETTPPQEGMAAWRQRYQHLVEEEGQI